MQVEIEQNRGIVVQSIGSSEVIIVVKFRENGNFYAIIEFVAKLEN